MRDVIMVTFLLALATAPGAHAHGNYKLSDGQLEVPGPVLYSTGSDEIQAESEETLQHVLGFLQSRADVTMLRIECHSDSQGGADENQRLTEARALAVARWLVAQGIDCKRLVAVGFGSSKPVEDESTPAGRAANRRTVFAPAALRGRLIGGMPADGSGQVAGDPCE